MDKASCGGSANTLEPTTMGARKTTNDSAPPLTRVIYKEKGVGSKDEFYVLCDGDMLAKWKKGKGGDGGRVVGRVVGRVLLPC